jgi:predicted RNA-binding protein with PUA-like domain
MKYWIIKSEPEAYSFDDLMNGVDNGRWDGVRNYQARNNLKDMKVGDMVLFYHSVSNKELVGICSVVKEWYPDPTDNTGKWASVDFKAVQKLKKPISLAEIKTDEHLKDIQLVKHSRLSVMPIDEDIFNIILSKSEE